MKQVLSISALLFFGLTFPMNVSAQLSTYYHESFENSIFPPAGWQSLDVLDPTYTWTRSSVRPNTGDYSAYIHWSPENIPSDDWLILPQFTAASSDLLSFWLALSGTDNFPDSTLVLVSTTDASPSSFTNVLGILTDGSNYPTSSFNYQYYSYSLSAFAGQSIYVAFENKNTFGDGVFIDDVSLGNPAILSASVESIDVPKAIATGTAIAPKATLKNNSTAVQSFPVTMTIGSYTSTENVINLASGDTEQVTFDTWTALPGDSMVTVTTQLAGDVYSGDDTSVELINVLQPFVNYGWRSKEAFPVSIFGPMLASSKNDSLVIAAGGITQFTLSNNADKFVSSTNSWIGLSPMFTGTFEAGTGFLNDFIYVIGGFDGLLNAIGDVQIYDPTFDSWSSGSPMPTPVADYAFGVYNDSLFYCMGGITQANGVIEDLVQIYNPANDTWINGTNLPIPEYSLRGGITGNTIVISGGYNEEDGSTARTYVGTIDPNNPANITWTQQANYPSGHIGRPSAGTSNIPGLVIFTAGDPSVYTDNYLGVTDYTFAFDVNSNTWKIGPPKPTAANNVSNLAPIVVDDSLFLVTVGGLDASQNLYDFNQWLNLGPNINTGINHETQLNFNFISYPNPFIKFTTIKFNLDRASSVKVVVMDVLGNEMEELYNGNLGAGNHQLKWDASDYAQGIYFCKMIVDGKEITEKLVKL